jgi:hypothetical protein
MIAQTLTTSFKLGLLQGIHDFSTDIFKIALYTSDASFGADTTAYSTTGEVEGTGYTAGGNTLTVSGPSSNGTTAYVSFNDSTWSNASFTTVGAVIYNSSKSNAAVAVLNFGNTKTAVGTFTVQFPAATASTAIIRIA